MITENNSYLRVSTYENWYLVSVDDVFQDLVESVTYVQVPIGIRRAIVQSEHPLKAKKKSRNGTRARATKRRQKTHTFIFTPMHLFVLGKQLSMTSKL